MLFNEKHIIKEAEVLTGEIVDDNVLVKEADIASSLAKIVGGGAGKYLASPIGKQLINRVGTGMAVGAAGGLLTSKEGDRVGGALKGGLLGGIAGGGLHAYQTGALGRFGAGNGQSLESMAGKGESFSIKNRSFSNLGPEQRVKAEGILSNIRGVEDRVAGKQIQQGLLLNQQPGLSYAARRGAAGSNVASEINKIAPHVEVSHQSILTNSANQIQGLGNNTVGRWGGSEGLGMGTRLTGLVRGKNWLQAQHIGIADGIRSANEGAIHNGLMTNVRKDISNLSREIPDAHVTNRYNTKLGKKPLGSVDNPIQQEAAAVPHTGGGLLTGIQPTASPSKIIIPNNFIGGVQRGNHSPINVPNFAAKGPNQAADEAVRARAMKSGILIP